MQRLRQVISNSADHLRLGLGVLVLLVAALQVYLTETTPLSAWKGGGFGMYTTPHGNTRSVFLVLSDTSVRLYPMDDRLKAWSEGLDARSAGFLGGLSHAAQSLRHFPRDVPADRLIAEAARVRWGLMLDPAKPGQDGASDGYFDPSTMRLVVTEMARRPSVGRIEQRVIFELAGTDAP